MSYDSQFLGGCPAPFYNVGLFNVTRGSAESRICLTPGLVEGKDCCLPCPATQWFFSDDYATIGKAAAGINIGSLACLVFVLVSYVFLPVQYTRSHYLNTCLIIAIMFINLGFIIPFANHSDPCADPATPNDMYSSVPCAFSGALILAGGLSGVMWVLVRALSMHLQICWDITPGRRFYYLTQLGGWAVPAAIFTAAVSVTGVSFRFGPGICHINHTHALVDLWVWLLTIAGIAIIIQLSTMVFCFHVYLRNMWADEETTAQTGANSNANAPSYTSSQRAPTARAIYRKLKRVLWLQWRGLTMVTIMLVDVVFFAVVFVYLDKRTVDTPENVHHATPWIGCLLAHANDPDQCRQLGQDYLVSEGTIAAVIILLSVVGIFLSALMLRWSFFTGWKRWAKNIFGHGDEFESIESLHQHGASMNNNDGRQQHGAGGAMFEMQEPTKDYEQGHQLNAEHSISSFDTPIEKYNGGAQYANHPHSPNYSPNTAHNYFEPVRGGPTSTTTITGGTPFDSPQMPSQSFSQPNPNIPRIRANEPPAPSQGPSYGVYEAPGTHVQPAFNNNNQPHQHPAYGQTSPYERSPGQGYL